MEKDRLRIKTGLEKAHEIMGSGSIPSCEAQASCGYKLCEGCCDEGAALFPEEDNLLFEQTGLSPEHWAFLGVTVTPGHIKGCSELLTTGEKQCKLRVYGKGFKPLSCKLFPLIRWKQPNEFTDVLFLNSAEITCPAFSDIDEKWLVKTTLAKWILSDLFGPIITTKVAPTNNNS